MKLSIAYYCTTIEFRKDTKVCCFSELGRSLLLWSLYADRSKGICFGFEGKYIGRAGKNLGLAHDRKCYSFDLETGMVFSDPILYEVIYQPSLPKQVNRVTNKNYVLLLDFLLTKQTEWVFEQEYRLIDLTPNEEPYILHKFKKEALKSVFLGYKTPSSVAVDVRDIIETEYLQKGYSVELYQMVPLDRKYALVPKKIDLDTL
jgi:hypothetical protein